MLSATCCLCRMVFYCARFWTLCLVNSRTHGPDTSALDPSNCSASWCRDLRLWAACLFIVSFYFTSKGKGTYTWYNFANHHLRSAEVWHMFSRVLTLLPAHPHIQSAIRMSHTCLCLPSYSSYSFTDPGGMECWVGLGGWLHSETVYLPEGSHPSQY